MKICQDKNSLMVVLGMALLLVWAAQAQVAIDWYTMDGGGGTSTGGVYAISGTIGQPDAGTSAMQGGNIALQGGFWALIGVLQTEGAPLLRIVNNYDGTATLLWAVDGSDGFQLRVATDLRTQDWADVPTAPSVVGDDYKVTVPVEGTRRFYQLRKQ